MPESLVNSIVEDLAEAYAMGKDYCVVERGDKAIECRVSFSGAVSTTGDGHREEFQATMSGLSAHIEELHYFVNDIEIDVPYELMRAIENKFYQKNAKKWHI